MFKCLGRVQDLLNEERVLAYGNSRIAGSETSSQTSFSLKLENRLTMDQFHSFFPQGPGLPDLTARHSTTAELVEISDATFCWKGKEEAPALYVMSLTIQPASFTAVIGP